MTWTAHYRNVFRRVDRDTWQEGEDLWQVTGGKLEMSAFSDLKVSGTLDFTGFSVPDSRDLVRVYHAYSTPDGDVLRPLATLGFSVSEQKMNGPVVSGTMECQSVLARLSSRKYGAPFTVTAGTQAVQLAVQLAESVGLRVNNPDPSAYTVRGGFTIERSKASYLAVVNRLLDVAGYASAWVDAYGVVQFTPYVEPTERELSLVLSDSGGVMYPELVQRGEWADTPSTVRLFYETEEEILSATASNVDPSSPSSVPYRGYEVTHDEEVQELEGETQADRLAALEAKALAVLVEKTSNVEYVEGSCMYSDALAPNNALGVEYAAAGLSWRGAVTNVGLSLSKSLKADFKARRFVRQEMLTEVTSEVVW